MSEGVGEPDKGEESSAGGAVQRGHPDAASAPTVRACPICKSSLGVEYYQVGDNVICPTCAAAHREGKNLGSFAHAVEYGAIAAILSTVVWFGIVKLTDSEWGLVAIAVGLFVGAAVHAGARGSGGARYQALAMALTYVAITFSKVPFIIDAMNRPSNASADAIAAQPGGEAPVLRRASLDGNDVIGAAPANEPSQPPTVEPAAKPSFGAFLLWWTIVFGVALVSPFLQGVEGIMGIVILAIGLYQAWKLNRRVPVSGPFRSTS